MRRLTNLILILAIAIVLSADTPLDKGEQLSMVGENQDVSADQSAGGRPDFRKRWVTAETESRPPHLPSPPYPHQQESN